MNKIIKIVTFVIEKKVTYQPPMFHCFYVKFWTLIMVVRCDGPVQRRVRFITFAKEVMFLPDFVCLFEGERGR